MKLLGEVLAGFVQQGLFTLWLIMIGAGCFFIFDRFDIQALWLQVVICVSPFTVAGVFLWWRQRKPSS